MWLRNYYNILTATMLCDDTLTSTSQPTDYNPPIMAHRPNGAWADIGTAHLLSSNNLAQAGSFILPPFTKGSSYYSVGYATSATPSTTTSGILLQCGSGTTAATYDDYRLETPITSGLSVVNTAGTLTQASTFDSGTHHISSKRSFTINNTSSSNITITEFGIFGHYSDSNVALIYRDVFSPITLAPGESAIVSFERSAEVYNYTPY